ncbi:MAG: alpha/beta hydrolase family protein [Myxococcota bacterium]
MRWFPGLVVGLAVLALAACDDGGGGSRDAADSGPDVDAVAPDAVAPDADAAGADVPLDPGPADVGAEDADADAADAGDADAGEPDTGPACVGDVCAADEEHAPDPSTWGPFPVGVTTFEVETTDDAGEPRTLVVEVWYPATEDARGGPYESIDLRARAPEGVPERIGDLEIAPIQTHQVRDAPVRAADGPYPMVLFSHGAFGIRFQSVFWTQHLASHGYVVPSVDHTGNTLYDMILEGGYDPELVVLNAIERPGDVQATLDAMIARHETPGDRFRGTIDPERLGLSGHSFGGYASFLGAWNEPRVKAIVPMAPFTSTLPVRGVEMDHFPVPVMMMAGDADRTLDPDEHMRPAYEKLPAPKHWFELKGGGHFTFSDVCVLDLEVVAEKLEIANADGVLRDGCGEDNLPTEVAHPLIRQFGIGFLNLHLRGSAGSAAWFSEEAAAEHAEVLVYESESP